MGRCNGNLSKVDKIGSEKLEKGVERLGVHLYANTTGRERVANWREACDKMGNDAEPGGRDSSFLGMKAMVWPA